MVRYCKRSETELEEVATYLRGKIVWETFISTTFEFQFFFYNVHQQKILQTVNSLHSDIGSSLLLKFRKTYFKIFIFGLRTVPTN